MTELCSTRTEVILNHVNVNVRGIGHGEARHRKYKRLKLGGGQAYDRSAVNLQFQEWLNKLKHNLLLQPALAENLRISCINVT
jgi:hypothetical protein